MRLVVELEASHRLDQGMGLFIKALGRCSGLFNEGSVLLGDFVHLRDSLADLFDTGSLFAAG